tara:strand:- start:381 stop:728 length:348 start_codon:yes stop_codon:yes gene_type:complete
MNKITNIAASVLLATQLNAQDTTSTMITLSHQVKFDYKTNKVISAKQHMEDYERIIIEVKDNEVLLLYLFDEKDNKREVIIHYPNGTKLTKVFSSENKGIYSPIGPFLLEIRKPE